MSIPDEQIVPYFELCTDEAADEVQAIASGLAEGMLHPGETKRRLARSIVDVYHGAGAGNAAEAVFDQVFREHRAPEDVPTFLLPERESVYLPALLKDAELVASSSEARRLLKQGAVKLNGEVVHDLEIPRARLAGATVQVGKRRFVRLLG